MLFDGCCCHSVFIAFLITFLEISLVCYVYWFGISWEYCKRFLGWLRVCFRFAVV